MSTKSLSWAFEQEGLSTTVKFVLVAMGDAAGDTGKSFSSNKTICKMTGLLKEETISECQAKLCELGLIKDTGQRTGTTGKIKVFQFPDEACKLKPLESPAKRGVDNPPPNGVLTNSIPRESPANPPSGEIALNKERGTGNGAVAPSRIFSDGWLVAFKMKHGFDYDYKKADGIAADRLLKKGVAPDELLSTAIKAWSQTDDKKFWNCVNLSHSVPKFCGAFNDIRTELRISGEGRKQSPGTKVVNGISIVHIPSGPI